MRQQKLLNILKECPNSECANESMEAYNEVNKEVDKFLNGISHEINECVRI